MLPSSVSSLHGTTGNRGTAACICFAVVGHLISFTSTIPGTKGCHVHLRAPCFADQSRISILSLLCSAPVSLYLFLTHPTQPVVHKPSLDHSRCLFCIPSGHAMLFVLSGSLSLPSHLCLFFLSFFPPSLGTHLAASLWLPPHLFTLLPPTPPQQ